MTTVGGHLHVIILTIQIGVEVDMAGRFSCVKAPIYLGSLANTSTITSVDSI
jgi:hypothetical protein